MYARANLDILIISSLHVVRCLLCCSALGKLASSLHSLHEDATTYPHISDSTSRMHLHRNVVTLLRVCLLLLLSCVSTN